MLGYASQWRAQGTCMCPCSDLASHMTMRIPGSFLERTTVCSSFTWRVMSTTLTLAHIHKCNVQWYHIRRRRPPSQRSTDASGPSTDAQHMLRPASTTYSASTGSAALHAADAAAEDVTEIYGRYGGSSSRGKKASRAVAEDTGTAQEKAPSVEPGKAAPAAAQIKDKEAAPASALALAAMMADTAKAVGKRQGTGEQQRAVRPPYMVVGIYT
eukprot:1094926-Pelagomonas_calceolata.AAC.1